MVNANLAVPQEPLLQLTRRHPDAPRAGATARTAGRAAR